MSTQPEMSLTEFLEQWPAAEAGLKKSLLAYRGGVLDMPGVGESFLPRPGVSYSLRWDLDPRPQGRGKPLFAMADVVPLGQDELMLSLCFYGDDISDPEELGNFIPGGLYGENGHCFDLEGDDPDLVAYCLKRAAEALDAARREA
jgi:hypothetical protein